MRFQPTGVTGTPPAMAEPVGRYHQALTGDGRELLIVAPLTILDLIRPVLREMRDEGVLEVTD